MLYAQDEGKRLIAASRGKQAVCPCCKSVVIAKCGSIKVWHWAHTQKDCDLWSEPETEWHKKWKEIVPLQNREVVLENHRADIRLDRGLVIELQNSSISVEEIRERENFYQEMIWLFNAQSFMENCILPEKYTFKHLTNVELYKQFITAEEWLQSELQERKIKADEFLKQEQKNIEAFYKKRIFSNDYFARASDEKAMQAKYYEMLKIPEEDCHPLCKGGVTLKVIGSKVNSNVLGRTAPTRSVDFRWLWARKTILSCSKPVLWDIGGHVLVYFDFINKCFKSTHQGQMCSAKLIPKEWFLNFYLLEN